MKLLHKRIDIILESGLNTDLKLQKICQLLYDEIESYDWVGFYFKNESKDELILGPYVGESTEHTVIPFGKGICGQVAVSNKTLVVQDVNSEDNYIACNLDVKSEIVVPIFKNNENIGQIDIDSHTLNAFSEPDQIFLEELCSKISKVL